MRSKKNQVQDILNIEEPSSESRDNRVRRAWFPISKTAGLGIICILEYIYFEVIQALSCSLNRG
jgi:regulation of enolase protein 1 (concanavalin A-like superfamily)